MAGASCRAAITQASERGWQPDDCLQNWPVRDKLCASPHWVTSPVTSHKPLLGHVQCASAGTAIPTHHLTQAWEINMINPLYEFKRLETCQRSEWEHEPIHLTSLSVLSPPPPPPPPHCGQKELPGCVHVCLLLMHLQDGARKFRNALP